MENASALPHRSSSVLPTDPVHYSPSEGGKCLSTLINRTLFSAVRLGLPTSDCHLRSYFLLSKEEHPISNLLRMLEALLFMTLSVFCSFLCFISVLLIAFYLFFIICYGYVCLSTLVLCP